MSVERVLFKFGGGVATALFHFVGRLFTPIKRHSPSPPKPKFNEAERMAGCRDVVMRFAVAYGHIARECMKREELEQLIDNGIAPQELSQELLRRIDAMPGVVLGVNTINSSVDASCFSVIAIATLSVNQAAAKQISFETWCFKISPRAGYRHHTRTGTLPRRSALHSRKPD
jgi:hypothetical protein